MKNSKQLIAAYLVMVMLTYSSYYSIAQNTYPGSGSVGIGTVTPKASSILEMKSTTQGVLIPRMTKTQRDAIASPVKGLLIYQTDNTQGLYYYDGTTWKAVSPKSKDWSLTGSSGTDPTLNFIGTTDAQPLKFKVNNIPAGELNPTNGNIALGMNSLFSNTTGHSNVAIGTNTLFTNTTRSNLVAVGDSALFHNGSAILYFATANTAIGSKALFSNTSGYYNTASGFETLYSNTSGNSNTANGYRALYSNTTASRNTANGFEALYSNTTGTYNTAIGYQALFNNTTGSSNTAHGYYSLEVNTTGNNNTATGSNALLQNNGDNNTASGYTALYSNTTGYSNTSNGVQALYTNTTGYENSANGFEALYSNISGNMNTANGNTALYSNTTGYLNNANGWGALFNNTTGYGNTAIGSFALASNSTGSSNIAIGEGADVFPGDLHDAAAIGIFSATNANYKIVIGTSSNNNLTGGYGAWQTFSDGRFKDNVQVNVPGLAFITKLRPVTYNLNAEKIDKFLGITQRMGISQDAKKIAQYMGRLKEISSQLQTGFIAQEVEATAKSIGYDFDGVHHPESDYDNYTIGYATFVVPLVKAVQELDSMNNAKNEQVKSLQSTVDDLQNENAALKTRLDKMDQTMQQFDQSLAECCSNYKSGGSFFGGDQSTDAPKLEQNIPNPFDQMTVIKFYLPQTATTVVIKIYSLDGVELKSFNVNQKGYGEISLAGNSLASGVYAYTLIINGQSIDTKQMILTK